VEGIKRTDKRCVIDTLYLYDLSLDHFTLKHYEPKTNQGKDFEKLRAAIENADGVVIATPIWNFSVPGHLKNAIDRMGSFGLDPETRTLGMLKGKPVYLLYTGGSPAIVWTGLQRRTTSHMPVSLRYFGMAVVGKHYEPRCTPGKGTFGLVVDKRAANLAEVRVKGGKFAKIAGYYAKTGKLPAWQTFLKHLFRFGQQMKRTLKI
jgi:NAD(P)H-dependent FMN reductase